MRREDGVVKARECLKALIDGLGDFDFHFLLDPEVRIDGLRPPRGNCPVKLPVRSRRVHLEAISGDWIAPSRLGNEWLTIMRAKLDAIVPIEHFLEVIAQHFQTDFGARFGLFKQVG